MRNGTYVRAPERVFIDPKCKIRLPIPLPDPAAMRVHRVVVAHGASERCRAEIGGSGSLTIMPQLRGNTHRLPRSKGGKPFVLVAYTETNHSFMFSMTRR